MNTGKRWAVGGFTIGIVVSVASNMFHSYLVTVDKPTALKWGSLLLSAFWPCAVFICIEIIAKVRWPKGFWYFISRYLGLSAVAGLAAYVSWKHMNGLLVIFGEETLVTYLAPVAIDGLMLLSSAALIAVAVNTRRKADETAVIPITLPPVEILLPPEPEPEAPAAEKILEPEPVIDHTDDGHIEASPKVEPAAAAPMSVAERAMQVYLDSTHNGHTLTGKELATMFQRSERWGRDVVSKAKAST